MKNIITEFIGIAFISGAVNIGRENPVSFLRKDWIKTVLLVSIGLIIFNYYK